MNLDNSGNSVVFDAKTQEAINIAKNRIDELNNDITRLQKQRQIEQADVKELQDEKAYLEEQAQLLRPEVDILSEQLAQVKQELTTYQSEKIAQEQNLASELKNLIEQKEQHEADVTALKTAQRLLSEENCRLDDAIYIFNMEKDNLRLTKASLVKILDTL